MTADYLGDPDFEYIEREVDRLLMLGTLERAEALTDLRRTDPARAAKVARWLQDIEASDGFLDLESRLPGQRIGAWALMRLLGRGGMGEVWLAERADGVYVKHAAIKFLRLDRTDTARRLIQERELLARLEHPNIARLLDAGEDARAGAYLITDWIDGRNLDQWLRITRPSLTQCLSVFRPIAEAVAYAHRQLIIHRDIKPANVMVDGEQRPFLLDFGIARILQGQTNLGESRDLAVTPNHAAPEQLQGQAVDTRADVYGLGALLYRLLTDQEPLPLKGLALAELVRSVCEQVPLAPSQRAADRGISRDLDTICLKALEKSPERRYQSVDALLADLSAYERGEPVQARQGGFGYRLGKFLWRHRIASSAAAFVLLAIFVGAGTTWWQARLAAKESERANAVKTFLMDLFASIDPEQSKGGQVLAEELVQAGELRLQQSSDLAPELRYELLSMLARMRLDLRQYDARLRNQIEACAQAAHHFGPASDEAVVCTIELADSQRQNGQHEAANLMLNTALQALEQAPTPDLLRLALAYEVRFMIERDLDHPDAAETAVRRSIELSRQAEPEIGAQTAHSLEQYAVFLNAAGRFAEAEPLLLEILAFDQAHPDARSRSEQINSRWNLLTYYWARERYRDVLTATANLTRETEADLGRNHSAYFRQQQLIANVHARMGEFEKAIQIRDSAAAIEGIDRWSNGNFRQMLWADQTLDLSALGRTADSQSLAERTLAFTDERKLPEAPAFIACYGALYSAAIAEEAAQVSRWSACLNQRFKAFSQAQQTGYRKFLLQAESLVLRQQQRPQEAVARLREAVASSQVGTESSHALQRLQANLAFALIDAGEASEAVTLLTDVRAKLIERFGPEHTSVTQIDAVLSELPASALSSFDSDALTSAAQRFQTRMGRPVDRLRLW